MTRGTGGGGLPPHSAEVIARILDKNARKTPGGWSCRCPAHEDRRASLSLSDAAGTVLWHCHAGCSQEAVQAELARHGLIGKGNGADTMKGKGNRRQWTAQPRPAETAPPPSLKHYKHGKPALTWCYRDEQGSPLFHVARFETSAGKEVLPQTWCRSSDGAEGWRWRAPLEPRPLYGLDRLGARPEAPVLVVEGEKSADAAPFPDHVAVTSQGGAKAACKSDWSPLAGRHVVIWPDNDPPGRKYAEDVAELATAAGARSVRMVAVPAAFGDGWDLADPAPAGADLESLLAAPEPWTAPAGTPEPAQAPNVQGGFRVGRGGVFRLVESQDGEREWVWMASEIEVLAETRNGSGEAWGRLIRVRDRDGLEHRWAMPMRMLAGDGVGYREQLLSLGAELAPGKASRDALHNYLTVWRPAGRARCVESTGWHGRTFVLPDQVYGSSSGEDVFLQAPGAAPQYDIAGSLPAWQSEVAALAVGNSRLVLAISAAFAAALLYPAQEESGGVHFFGTSSTGKTTIGLAAASVWGIPKRSWRTTANAAEATARGSCDALLFLDEIGQAEPWVIDGLAYMLGNESGKARMRRDATARETLTWRTLFLSTAKSGS